MFFLFMKCSLIVSKVKQNVLLPFFALKFDSFVFIFVLAAVMSIMFIVSITPVAVTEFSHF